ncbi:MAG: hypothetical protein IJ474_02430, partial [Mailhella sp.]|nr:hypothetical protein [Mailhella sp.]
TMKSRFSDKDAAWYRGAVHDVEALDYVRIAALEDASRPQVPARQEKKKEKRVKVKASTTAKRTAAVQETQIIVRRKSSGPAAKKGGAKRGAARSGHRGVRRIAGLNEGAAPERAEE